MSESSHANSRGCVYLVGAGPGNPQFLTLRAVECLAAADLVIYDLLVDPRALVHAPQAESVCISELGESHGARWERIRELMLRAARDGKTVVRLKGGDPGIFGRMAEEAGSLREAGVSFEIVPGVTAALAAGAWAGIPLTDRQLSSGVALVTGHECPGKQAGLDWASLAAFPGTLVVYMGVSRLRELTTTLVHHGKPESTPVAVVHCAGSSRQRTIMGTLRDIAATATEAGVSSPAVIIVGSVVELRQRLAWAEHRPLFGREVLVTRPAHQAAGLVRLLESQGAMVYSAPVVDIGPAPDLGAVDNAIARLSQFHWLVFTSANGVREFLNRVLALGADMRVLGRVRLAAIGPRTAEALASFHLKADLVPSVYRSEELAEELLPHVAGQRILLARANRGRELLLQQLETVATVEQVAVYSHIDRLDVSAEVMARLKAGLIDYVLLTSPSIAEGFLRLIDEAGRNQIGHRIRLVAISPVTGNRIRELGYRVAVEAKEHTSEGMVEALLAAEAHLSSRRVSTET